MSATTLTPEVLWAQRSSETEAEKNVVYLTIMTPDVPASGLKLDLKPASLTFTGTNETKGVTYHVELEFFAEIDVENSKTHHTPRAVEFVLRKKEAKEEFWPRLLKDKKKVHYLKTDFDKWVDEDEQNEAPENPMDFGGGMPGGMPGGMDFGDMAGLGGLGGAGGLDFSKMAAGMGDEDMDGDEDEEMPGLEGEEEPAAGEKKPVIEEIS